MRADLLSIMDVLRRPTLCALTSVREHEGGTCSLESTSVAVHTHTHTHTHTHRHRLVDKANDLMALDAKISRRVEQ